MVLGEVDSGPTKAHSQAEKKCWNLSCNSRDCFPTEMLNFFKFMHAWNRFWSKPKGKVHCIYTHWAGYRLADSQLLPLTSPTSEETTLSSLNNPLGFYPKHFCVTLIGSKLPLLSGISGKTILVLHPVFSVAIQLKHFLLYSENGERFRVKNISFSLSREAQQQRNYELRTGDQAQGLRGQTCVGDKISHFPNRPFESTTRESGFAIAPQWTELPQNIGPCFQLRLLCYITD